MNPNSEEVNSKEVKKSSSVRVRVTDRIRQIHWKQVWEKVLLAAVGAIVGFLLSRVLPPSPPDDSDKKQIENLISSEANLALAHDLEKYRNLFAADAWMIEVTTKQVWRNQDQITERLRPLHFKWLLHTPKDVFITKDRSVAFAETETTFDQVEPNVPTKTSREYWQFAKIDGRWKIVSFQYALPN